MEFDDKKTPLCMKCFLSRCSRVFPSIKSTNNIASEPKKHCPTCSDWWIDDRNKNGWSKKPCSYPSPSSTSFETSTPIPPQGRDISDETNLPPCKILFSFLLQAYEYAKYHYLQKNGWTQNMTKTYLCTCCFSGEIIEQFLTGANEVKQNDSQESILQPPNLWREHEWLDIKIKHFADAPMHMLFLGVTKHLLAHVERLFGNKNSTFQIFSGIISQHIKFGRNISLDWCPIVDFADGDLLTTTGWQSTQYVAFSRLSLVYFGLIEDFHEIDTRKQKSFQQVFVLWFKLISSLFTNNECNKEIVDDCVRLFLSSCICYGNSTKKVPNNKGDVNEEKKKLKGHKSEAVFLKTRQTILVC